MGKLSSASSAIVPSLNWTESTVGIYDREYMREGGRGPSNPLGNRSVQLALVGIMVAAAILFPLPPFLRLALLVGAIVIGLRIYRGY